MFKGKLKDGTDFTVSKGTVACANEALRAEIQDNADFSCNDYYPDTASLDNHIGQWVVSFYGGSVVDKAVRSKESNDKLPAFFW